MMQTVIENPEQQPPECRAVAGSPRCQEQRAVDLWMFLSEVMYCFDNHGCFLFSYTCTKKGTQVACSYRFVHNPCLGAGWHPQTSSVGWLVEDAASSLGSW